MNIQVILIGLAEGSIYALLATPIVLLYRLTGVANFAQGAMASFCTFVLFALLQTRVPMPLGLLLAFVFSLALGWLLYGALWLARRLGTIVSSDHTTPLILTLGLYEVLNSLMVVVWDANPRNLGLFTGGNEWKFTVAGGVVTGPQMLMMAALLVTAVAYYVVIQKTRFGLMMRMASSDDEAAEVLGVDTNRVRIGVWMAGSALGLVAGILASTMIYLSPDLMNSLILKAFVAAIIGGMNSVGGAMAGGLVLGLVTALAGALVGTGVKDAVAVALAAVVLLAFPRGLLGRRLVKRV